MASLGRTAHRSLALALLGALAAGGGALAAGGTAAIARGQRAEHAGPEATAEPDAPSTAEEVEAESREVSEGGEKVKAIRFSGLGVAGRLKSPQLLYFLNRLRAEFDRPRLPHRSFMPEMERSTHSKSF